MNTDDRQIQQLGFLISQFSEKAADVYMENAHELAPFLSREDFVRWVQVGALLARNSGATAVKYFRESPRLFREMGPGSPIGEVLTVASKLAEKNYGVAIAFLRECPRVISEWPFETVSQWAAIGGELGTEDYGTAVEYFKGTPPILHSLGIYQLEAWGKLGLTLSKEDLKTKDFLGLEFFRLSSETLAKIKTPSLRSKALAMTSALTQASGKLAMEFFKEVPVILSRIKTTGECESLFALGTRLAEISPGCVTDLFRNSPEILNLLEGSIPKFEEWADRGIQMAKSNPEGSKAYFSLRLKIAQEKAKELSHGLFLREVARTLRFYAEGMCGKNIEIRTGTGPMGIPNPTGGIIILPEKMTEFPTIEENFVLYKIMVLHESAHFEFGTYDEIPHDGIKNLPIIRKNPTQGPSTVNLSGFCALFPDPLLARNLWTVVEEGRIDYLLHHEYPGIRADLNFVITQQLKGRPLLSELPPKQAFLEALLQLSIADLAEVPLEIAQEVSEAYGILKTTQYPGASLMDTVRAVASLYPLAERYQAGKQTNEEENPKDEEPQTTPPQEFPMEGHEPMVNFSYRGPLDLEKIDRFQTTFQAASQGPLLSTARETTSQLISPPSNPEDVEKKEGPSKINPKISDDTFEYDEWDFQAGDFKPRWCRLHEKKPELDSPDSMASLQAEYGGPILSLRRFFECLRPESFKKIKKQEHGEEIDLEAAIQSFIEKKAQGIPDDRVYLRREKKERSVSVAFLIDMSGSTSQRLEGSSKRVIDIQKEGLILLTEALEAVGDEYALYGFSGQSRNQVDCFPIKGFDDPCGTTIRNNIGGIQPLGQNRDGAAIRHITHKLNQRSSKIKLLILISDGKPLDDDYSGNYALEDTKMALRQARASGIYPFCITVDPSAPDYIEKMYGDVRYTIIQNVHTLPQKLPKIYKALTT